MSVGNKTKMNKAKFASLNKELKKLQRNDPIQFNVLYNEWKRQQKHNYYLR